MESEFDRHARDYDAVLRASMPAGMDEDQYYARYKIGYLVRALRGRRPGRILDFGCGAGRSLAWLGEAFPDTQLCGFDPSAESLRIARERMPAARLSNDWIELCDAPFDAILAANVFHHITANEHIDWLRRCAAALAPSGSLFVFEHNPRNPLTRHVFERCPFDVDAHMIARPALLAAAREAGLALRRTNYTLFFPKPLKALRPLERLLGWLPLGAQYCVEFSRP